MKPQDRLWQMRLTLSESSLLLEALVEVPFKQVFELIGKLNHEAQNFYVSDAALKSQQLFSLDARELSLCIKSLGNLPYNRVQGLLQNLHLQMQDIEAEKEKTDD